MLKRISVYVNRLLTANKMKGVSKSVQQLNSPVKPVQGMFVFFSQILFFWVKIFYRSDNVFKQITVIGDFG